MKPVSFATLRAAALPLVVTAMVGALGSCSVGDGILPVDAKIQPVGGVIGATSSKAYTCLNTGLSLFLYFSNGSVGDFTGRATFTSSNPNVAKVSNSDVATLDNPALFYQHGTIVPIAAGTTTITAKYLSFTRTLDVTVSPIANFRTVPASADLAVNSGLDLAAVADLDGVETPIDAAVSWAFVTPNTSVATIDATSGTIRGVAVGGLTAQARIPACGQTVDAAVNVANLQSLALTREFGDNQNLILATSERLIATGTLDNGKTQDLSVQVAYTSSDATALSFFTGTLANLSFAVKAVDNPVQVTATFANPAIVSPAIGIKPVADSLNSVTVSPATVTVPAGRPSQFTANGSFASGATQDITRHVVWTSADTTSATIQTSASTGINGFAGLTSTSPNAGGKSVLLTATVNNGAGTPISAAGTINIQ